MIFLHVMFFTAGWNNILGSAVKLLILIQLACLQDRFPLP